jgi:folylpolyglutamate synthase/dihydropteroate synthase
MDWRNPITKAMQIKKRNLGQEQTTSPFLQDLPEKLSLEQIDITAKAKMLQRAAENMQSSKLNLIAMNFELMALAVMWYGQVSAFLL